MTPYLRVNFGALTDMVTACRPDPGWQPEPDDEIATAEWREAQSATMRAIATMVGGGYQCGNYKVVFFWLKDQIDQGTSTPAIVKGLLDTYGVKQ